MEPGREQDAIEESVLKYCGIMEGDWAGDGGWCCMGY
jgi:hypothetical protein